MKKIMTQSVLVVLLVLATAFLWWVITMARRVSLNMEVNAYNEKMRKEVAWKTLDLARPFLEAPAPQMFAEELKALEEGRGRHSYWHWAETIKYVVAPRANADEKRKSVFAQIEQLHSQRDAIGDFFFKELQKKEKSVDDYRRQFEELKKGMEALLNDG